MFVVFVRFIGSCINNEEGLVGFWIEIDWCVVENLIFLLVFLVVIFRNVMDLFLILGDEGVIEFIKLDVVEKKNYYYCYY